MDNILEKNNRIVEEPTISVHETIHDEKFKPKGALAFFALLLLLTGVIWYGIYYIQLTRQ